MIKNIVKCWGLLPLTGKFWLIFDFLIYPSFIIHEISHIFVIFCFRTKIKYYKYVFLKIEDTTLVVYKLNIDTINTKDIENFFICIAPSISYFTCLISNLVWLNNSDTLYPIISLFYIVICFKQWNLSKVDLESLTYTLLKWKLL